MSAAVATAAAEYSAADTAYEVLLAAMRGGRMTAQRWEALGHIVRTGRTADDGGFLVADVSASPLRERAANARLIACAPELLAACQAIAALANGQGQLNLMMVAGQARAALAKAGAA